MDDLHVIYIEDHPASRRIMQLLLQDAIGVGCVTLLESTQDLATQLSEVAQPIDLVLTDLHLYPIDGFEVCRLLRSMEMFRDLPIIGVTASVSPTEMRQMQEIGFNGVITKPISHITFPLLFQRIIDGEAVWED